MSGREVPRLVADIGATYARFALYTGLERHGDVAVLATQEYLSADELIYQARLQLSAVELAGMVLAVAGPVTPEGITMTNTPLQFLPPQLCAQFNCPVHVVNDFFALAHGVGRFQNLARLDDLTPHPGGVAAVIGPGSGLGMATVVPLQQKLHVLSGEGGHAGLSPGSHLEAELWSNLSMHMPHVSWESVLCGPGLVRLYAALCEVWGAAPGYQDARTIAQQAQDMADPVCHQTLEIFCSLLGQAASNLALTVGATGGVYIAGGIVPDMVDFVRASPLRRRFEEAGSMTDYVKRIPLAIVLDPEPGLLGAAACLDQLLALDAQV
ncbi:MAG: ROK family protein [Pseudomonadota bacterium]